MKFYHTILGNLQKKYFGAWRMTKGKGATEEEKPKEEKQDENGDEEVLCVCAYTCAYEIFQQEPKWKVGIKCALQLIIGVGLVTLFSDPMVDALTDLTDSSHKSGTYIVNGTTHHYNYGSHIPIGSQSHDALVTTQ